MLSGVMPALVDACRGHDGCCCDGLAIKTEMAGTSQDEPGHDCRRGAISD
jgi:hypothetical protein